MFLDLIALLICGGIAVGLLLRNHGPSRQRKATAGWENFEAWYADLRRIAIESGTSWLITDRQAHRGGYDAGKSPLEYWERAFHAEQFAGR